MAPKRHKSGFVLTDRLFHMYVAEICWLAVHMSRTAGAVCSAQAHLKPFASLQSRRIGISASRQFQEY